jgi:AcrR family transcriptional regulator
MSEGRMDAVAVEKWTPERRRQLTRDSLIDAAATVFARRGFHGASLEEIAETAGFTRGAIYKNFADKEDLFMAVNERFNERAIQGFADLLATEGYADNLGAVAAKWAEMRTIDPEFFVLGAEFNLYLIRNPDARARAVERRHETVRRVAELMRQTAATFDFEMPIPVEDLAWIFIITSDGFRMAALVEPDLDRLYEPFLELFSRGVFDQLNPDPNTAPNVEPKPI